MPEEEEQEIENLFKKKIVKEIDFQEVQETQRVPTQLHPRKHTPKAHHNYITQDER